MGILNVTPDSFSDGGKFFSLEKAREHAHQLIADGADILDVGAESSRPNFIPMSADEEISRLEPFLKMILSDEKISVPISLDTFKAKTAAFGAQLGVNFINDIWGLQNPNEPNEMAKVAAKFRLPVIAMHNQSNTNYDGDIIQCIKKFFRKTQQIAEKNHLNKENLIYDVGIGFGKTPEQNLTVLKRLDEFFLDDEENFAPMLLGTSRKSFIGHSLNLKIDERDEATGTTCLLGALAGCSIVRVHDVKKISRMCRMLDVLA